MENNTVINQEIEANEIFKVTALLYFKEALINQEYESCQELVGIAKELGATQREISETIIGYLRGDKAEGRGAKEVKNRVRSLKEK